MRAPLSILITAMIASTAFLACSEQKTAAVEDPVALEARLQEEAEAARRSEETEALAGRLSSAAASIGQLADSTSAQLPSSLEESAQGLRGPLEEVQALQAELASATGDAWSTARDRLDQALGELEQAATAATAALADWNERERAAVAERESEGLPIDPVTGLLQGLDGGDYPPYLISAVERVQGRLRALGLYAGPVDGVFDTPLRSAVGSFQDQEGLPASGVPSPITRGRLFPG